MRKASRMKLRRLELGFSAQEMAEKIGVTRPTYLAYETGKYSIPEKRLNTIKEAFEITDKQLADFFVEVNSPKRRIFSRTA